MTSSQSCLRALQRLRCSIFQTSYNPTSMRTGAKYLRARLRGPSMIKYYPKEVNFAKIIRTFPELELVDTVEQQRLIDIEDRKRRGKGAPKKAATKGYISFSHSSQLAHSAILKLTAGDLTEGDRISMDIDSCIIWLVPQPIQPMVSINHDSNTTFTIYSPRSWPFPRGQYCSPYLPSFQVLLEFQKISCRIRPEREAFQMPSPYHLHPRLIPSATLPSLLLQTQANYTDAYDLSDSQVVLNSRLNCQRPYPANRPHRHWTQDTILETAIHRPTPCRGRLASSGVLEEYSDRACSLEWRSMHLR
jgi:small subunit ribosomal protein S33